MRLCRTILAAVIATFTAVAVSVAQTHRPSAPPAPPARAIRRDIPMTNMIRRAFAAGTRDSTGRPGRNYWQLRTEYTINARFDVPTATVSGRETVIITNPTDSALNGVQLRLDQNIFAPNAIRAEAVSEITTGMTVTAMTFNGQNVDLHPAPLRFGPGGQRPQIPLALFGGDVTSARLALPTPLPAHGTGTLTAEWSFKVPRADNGRGMRMGSWGDSLYQVAQWYPRVAVYDDLRGWDQDPYLGPSEFYNNFGHFDVTIDMPAGWLVGATGVLQNPADVLTPAAQQTIAHALDADTTLTVVSGSQRGPGQSTVAGDRLSWHFVADSVADFAWATSDRFVYDISRATIPGGRVVPINIFYEPGHAQPYSQVGPRVRHALEFYSTLWMPYAFPGMTVVDGPENGMEYPSFIMSGLGAADHETGHQWWPMMVGINETWYGFMDEGFNQYMNILSGADRNHQPASLDLLGQSYGRISGDEREAPLMWDANYGGPLYSFQAYGKAPQMLSMLGGIVGDTAVWQAQSAYANAWRFKHPSPWDYAFFMSNALHADLGWFWYYWLFTTESVDGSIAGLKTAAGRTTVTVRQDGEMPSPVVLKVKFTPHGPAIRPMRNAVMADSATAIVTWPVDVWFNGSRTFNAVLTFGPRHIDQVILDPHCRFPDRDVSDNMWPRDTTVAPNGTIRGTVSGPFGPQPKCYGS